MAGEVRSISPTYERLCLGVAGDAELLAHLDELPAAKRQPNLLLAATRLLGGPIGSYAQLREWVLASWPSVSEVMLARRTQTNEPARCATLLPVLAALPQPLALLEVGASAGLCLYPDRYAYRYVTPDGDRVVGEGPVEFPCIVDGAVPLPDRVPEVVWRAGLDLNPLDIRDDAELRWLEALVWPEETERLHRLRAAVAIVRADPPAIERGDLLHDVGTVAAAAPRDATLVVFHSAVFAYVEPAARERFGSVVDALRRDRPVCWVSNEAPGVVSGTAVDTGGRPMFVLARDAVPVALTGSHGQSVEWLAR